MEPNLKSVKNRILIMSYSILGKDKHVKNTLFIALKSVRRKNVPVPFYDQWPILRMQS